MSTMWSRICGASPVVVTLETSVPLLLARVGATRVVANWVAIWRESSGGLAELGIAERSWQRGEGGEAGAPNCFQQPVPSRNSMTLLLGLVISRGVSAIVGPPTAAAMILIISVSNTSPPSFRAMSLVSDDRSIRNW